MVATSNDRVWQCGVWTCASTRGVLFQPAEYMAKSHAGIGPDSKQGIVG